MKRRALLSTALGSGVLLSGCLRVGGEQGGEGTTVEIIPSNATDQDISLTVAVYATDGSLLLDHTYSIDAGQTASSQSVEDRVDHLLVSPNDGEQLRHEYAPDVEICSRDGEDVQIIFEPEEITFAYTC